MSVQRNCRYCGVSFTADRDDHWFHSPACVAAYYRQNPNPEYIHEEKDHTHLHFCEFCGKGFFVNDYAQRGGKRAPKYCSPKCKQAAYRARGKGTQQQADRRYSGPTGGKQGEQQRQQRQQNTGAGAGAGASQAGASDGFWSNRNKGLKEAYLLLGLAHGATLEEVKRAYRKLMSEWHPDRNHAPNATDMTQRINWAYQYIAK